MKLYELERQQILNAPLAEVWNFFSNPANLNAITPPDLRFEITSRLEPNIYPGQIICYRIEIFPGLKWPWVTEITHLQEERYFVDEQRFGPYAFWHHKHFFEELERSVRIIDHIHYALPFGSLGQVVHALAIKRRLEQIFDYRYQLLEKMFRAA